jgi:23S rRNA pseudouridine2604 synthase
MRKLIAKPAPKPLAPSGTAAAPAATGLAQVQPGQLRLSKRIADLGLASRREADEWIERGWVRVNGEVVDVLGSKVTLQDRISIDRAAQAQQAQLVTVLLHKPVGYVSGQAEDGYMPAFTLVQAASRWERDTAKIDFHPRQLKNLVPAGRLDIDSTGLLVLTQDGRVARQVIGSDSSIEKEYLVRVQGRLSAADLALLNFGMALDGKPLKRAKVEWQNEDQLRFVLNEGKKRQIRRMCEFVGLTVTGLKRIRIGKVVLGDLPVGQWRYLRPDERFE